MGARVLFGLLLSYRNLKRICPSQETLGGQIGVTRGMVSRYLKELQAAEYITYQKEGLTCVYEFTDNVYNSIETCKQSYGQETNIRNKAKKVYKASNSKKGYKNNNSHKEIMEEYDEWNI